MKNKFNFIATTRLIYFSAISIIKDHYQSFMDKVMKKRLVFVVVSLLIITFFIIYFNIMRKEKTDIIRTTGIVEGNEANISTVIQGRISIL